MDVPHSCRLSLAEARSVSNPLATTLATPCCAAVVWPLASCHDCDWPSRPTKPDPLGPFSARCSPRFTAPFRRKASIDAVTIVIPPDTAMPTYSGIIPAPISSFFSNCIARSTIFNSTVGTSMGRTLADPCADRCGACAHAAHGPPSGPVQYYLLATSSYSCS